MNTYYDHDRESHWYDRIDWEMTFSILLLVILVVVIAFGVYSLHPECPRCHYHNHPSAVYCDQCGQQMRITEDNIEQ